MSLATRCAACGTVFRVVQDQLRVSSGWVRCGRCGEVFNAIESLVDLETDRPGDGGLPSVHGARVMEDLARVAGKVEPGSWSPPPSPAADAYPPGDVEPGRRDKPSIADTGPLGHELASEPEASARRPLDVVFDSDGDVPATGLPPTASTPGLRPWPTRATEHPPPKVAPGFVRQAERAARWRHPAMRAGLSMVAVVAAAVLGWQVSVTHHDWLAARWPVLTPVVEQMCAVGGCRLEPPRRIESLVVDSSGLIRSDALGQYRLTAVMFNRSSLALRVPAVDLAITDALGQVIARRVLAVSELGVDATEIKPGAELLVAATLEVTAAPVVGYTIELFYP